jgi:hypothetical protein
MGGWSTLCKCGTYTLFTYKSLHTPGHVVDYECDIPIESFVVHTPSVELSRTQSHYLVVTLFLSFVMEMFLVYGYEIT